MMPMDIYQHDSAAIFRFVLRGHLADEHVLELEHAWTTARSILQQKESVVDVSGISDADPQGADLLHRMRDAGARLTAALPPKSEELLRSLGVPAAAPCGRSLSKKLLRLLRSAGVKYLGYSTGPVSSL
jgi:ABC-type transporter Mla MlaB component